MERIEVMRLSLETLAKIKKLPKAKGDAVREVRQLAEIFAIYLVQDRETEKAAPARNENFNRAWFHVF
jgi:hypothetical protein